MTTNQKEELLQKVVQWAKERKINTCTPLSQRVKRGEELLELENAIRDNDLEEIKDAIGDVLVCVINEELIMNGGSVNDINEILEEVDVFVSKDILSALEFRLSTPLLFLTQTAKVYNLDMWECLEHAYNEIKDRKGFIINGTYVKEGDMPSTHIEEFKRVYGHDPKLKGE